MAAADDLQVANALKQHIRNLPLLALAEEVSLEIEKEARRYSVNPSSCRYFATSLCPRSCANFSASLPSSVRICKPAPWASSIFTISRCPFAAAVSNGEYPFA